MYYIDVNWITIGSRKAAELGVNWQMKLDKEASWKQRGAVKRSFAKRGVYKHTNTN